MSIRKMLGMTLGHALALGSLVALPVVSAHAGSHTWDVNEVFSDVTGNIQFIELLEKNGTTGETAVPGHLMNSSTNSKSFTITGPALATPTSNKSYLMGTAAFAALPGAPEPDAIIPPSVLPFFFSTAGDSVFYNPWDTFAFGAVPTDGINSLNAPGPVGTTATNSPTNYSGVSGSVDASAATPAPPPVPVPYPASVLGSAPAPAATLVMVMAAATIPES